MLWSNQGYLWLQILNAQVWWQTFSFRWLIGEGANHILRRSCKESLSALFALWTTQSKQNIRAIFRMQIWMTLLFFPAVDCTVSQRLHLEFNLAALREFGICMIKSHMRLWKETLRLPSLLSHQGRSIQHRLWGRRGNTVFFWHLRDRLSEA